MIPKEGILLKTKASSGIQARLIRGCKATSSPRLQFQLHTGGLKWRRYQDPCPVSCDLGELFNELKRRKLLKCLLPSTSTTSLKAASIDIVEQSPCTLERMPEAGIRFTLSDAKTKKVV